MVILEELVDGLFVAALFLLKGLANVPILHMLDMLDEDVLFVVELIQILPSVNVQKLSINKVLLDVRI